MNADRPRGNQRRNIQKRGRRKLGKLLARQDYKCHWCEKPLVRYSTFNQSVIIQKAKDWITWEDEIGDKYKSWWATTDHLIPVRENGESTMENMVAACGPCNRRRTACPNPCADPPKWIGSPKCKCGGDKPFRQKRCDACRSVSVVLKEITKRFYISREEGPCRRCGRNMVPLPEQTPIGTFYHCQHCKRC